MQTISLCSLCPAHSTRSESCTLARCCCHHLKVLCRTKREKNAYQKWKPFTRCLCSMFALKRNVRVQASDQFLRFTPPCLYSPANIVCRISISRWRRPFSQTSQTAAKRVVRKKVQELVQGPIAELSLPPSDKSDLKPDSLMDVVDDCMRKFPNCVLLTKVGNFYEVSSPASPAIRS